MPKSKRPNLSEAQELQQLNRNWQIHYQNVTTLDDWSAHGYPSKNVFGEILKIKKITFAEYWSQRLPKAAIHKRLRIRELQGNARRCKAERDNEMGWVNNVANIVLERLNCFEFKCRMCKDYIWLPDHVVLPEEPIARKSLENDFATRKICQCSDLQRASNSAAYLRPTPPIFSNKSDERVHHTREVPQGVKLEQKYQRPDRVYGLSVSKDFDRLRGTLARYSPFKGKHTLFPFLVVEAKSEKSPSGFEDTERQAALSIYTCLDIQKKLVTETKHPLECMVWFFCFRGDEWRLYIAVPMGDRTMIIDVWHGHIGNTDEALQLLLIIDCICYWARDVFKPGVLNCLAKLPSEASTPATTVCSSQDIYLPRQNTEIRETSLVVRSSRPPTCGVGQGESLQLPDETISTHDSDDEMMENALDEESSMRYYSSQGSDDNPVSGDNDSLDDSESDDNDVDDDDSSGPEGSDSLPMHVIRGTNNVSYRWKYLALPETAGGISKCLNDVSRNRTIKSLARTLWNIFTKEEHTCAVTAGSISSLVRGSIERVSSDDRCVPMFLACHCCFDAKSWNIVRTVFVITCSASAAVHLAEVADRPVINGKPDSGNSGICDNIDILYALEGLHNLDGKTSLLGAANFDVYLAHMTGMDASYRVGWEKGRGSVIRDAIHLFYDLAHDVPGPDLDWRLLDALAHPRVNNISLSRLPIPNTLNTVSGIILKRPRRWPTTTPLWCFHTFKPQSRESIGSQITIALEQNAAFIADEDQDESDRQAILDWAASMGEVIRSMDGR